jgi:hypothetical protein
MLRLLEKRDKKEAAIDALKEMENINRRGVIRLESQVESKLKDYRKWKEENGIEGLKY